MAHRRFPRRSDFIRSIPRGERLSSDDAFIDRVKLDFGSWRLSGREDEILACMNEFREQAVEDENGNSIPLFRHGIIESIYQRPKIYFDAQSEGRFSFDRRLLINGEVDWALHHHQGRRRRSNRNALHFNTTLNLTRYVQAQSAQVQTRPHGRPMPQPTLVITPQENWYQNEKPLVPCTNLIIGRQPFYTHAQNKPVSEHLANYLRHVDKTIEGVMSSVFENLPVAPERDLYFSLQEIEFYWEFDHPSPIDYVQSIAPRMRRIGERIYEDEMPARVEHVVNRQSPSIKVPLYSGVFLKVYAKTDRRVRFEIEFKSEAISEITCGGQTSSTRYAIVQKATELSEQAAYFLNEVRSIVFEDDPSTSSLTVTSLLHAICQHTATAYQAEAVVASLVAFDRLCLSDHDPIAPAVRTLCDTGVLERVPSRRRTYTVTATYRQALERLKRFR